MANAKKEYLDRNSSKQEQAREDRPEKAGNSNPNNHSEKAQDPPAGSSSG